MPNNSPDIVESAKQSFISGNGQLNNTTIAQIHSALTPNHEEKIMELAAMARIPAELQPDIAFALADEIQVGNIKVTDDVPVGGFSYFSSLAIASMAVSIGVKGEGRNENVQAIGGGTGMMARMRRFLGRRGGAQYDGINAPQNEGY